MSVTDWLYGFYAFFTFSSVFLFFSKPYIGTSSFCRSRFEQHPDSGEVISIYFMPDFIGKGYGHQLFETVLGELRKQGYLEVFLWVLEENVRARHFYESYGFSKTDDYLNDNIGGKEVREVRYVYRFGQTQR